MIHPPGLEGARFGEAADGDPRHDPSAAAALHAAGAPEGVAFRRQVHGSGVLVVTAPGRHGEADALVTTTPGVGVGVATADCVPVVIEGAGFAAVVHAGWRGVVAGVVEATLDRIASLGLTAEHAAIGPAIGPCCYEVGPEVAERFPGHTAVTTQGAGQHRPTRGRRRHAREPGGVAERPVHLHRPRAQLVPSRPHRTTPGVGRLDPRRRPVTGVGDGFSAVIDRVAAAADRAGRSPEQVTVVAVSKGQPVEAIRALYERGHRHFGENRAAELEAKAPQLPDDVVWHFVGTVQRRKLGIIRARAALVHSFDRMALVAPWGGAGAPPVLVQVNLAAEPQKHGADRAAVASVVDAAEEAGIRCQGLMVMPPLAADPEDSRPWFGELAELRRRLAADHPSLVELSMGMSDDFEVAVEEGATLIRVGRAIFGERT